MAAPTESEILNYKELIQFLYTELVKLDNLQRMEWMRHHNNKSIKKLDLIIQKIIINNANMGGTFKNTKNMSPLRTHTTKKSHKRKINCNPNTKRRKQN